MANQSPRLLAEGLTYHVRVQCNNKDFRFEEVEDFALYLQIIREIQKRYGFLLHDYVLMHSHVHLHIMTPGPVLLDKIMWAINRTFSQRYNKQRKRCGHLWMGPYRSTAIQDDAYAIACLRYFAWNPLKAGIAQQSEDWPWSGYAFYADGTPNAMLTYSPAYLGLSQNMNIRQHVYRALINLKLTGEK